MAGGIGAEKGVSAHTLRVRPDKRGTETCLCDVWHALDGLCRTYSMYNVMELRIRAYSLIPAGYPALTVVGYDPLDSRGVPTMELENVISNQHKVVLTSTGATAGFTVRPFQYRAEWIPLVGEDERMYAQQGAVEMISTYRAPDPDTKVLYVTVGMTIAFAGLRA